MDFISNPTLFFITLNVIFSRFTCFSRWSVYLFDLILNSKLRIASAGPCAFKNLRKMCTLAGYKLTAKAHQIKQCFTLQSGMQVQTLQFSLLRSQMHRPDIVHIKKKKKKINRVSIQTSVSTKI